MAKTPENSVTLSQSLVDDWKNAIQNRAKVKGKNKGDLSFFEITNFYSPDIQRIWHEFNTERDKLSQKSLNQPKNIMAYMLGFHLANCARVQMVLNRALRSHSQTLTDFFNRKDVKVVDLGCGTGALSQSTLHWLTDKLSLKYKPKSDLYDQNKLLLATAQDLVQKEELLSGVETCKTPLHLLKTSYFKDEGPLLIGMSYLLNELDKNPKTIAFIHSLAKKLADHQHPTGFMFLEPAKKTASRNAQLLREELVKLGYSPLYPCPNSGPCPMLAKSKDWCFSEGTWRLPSEQRKIDALTGIKRSKINTSAYLLVKGVSVAPGSTKVVVGNPTKQSRASANTDYETLLCDGHNLSKVAGSRRLKPFRGIRLKLK